MKAPKLPYYRIRKTRNGEYRWTLKAKNGKVTSNGETYPTIQGVQKGIRDNRKNASTENIFLDIEIKRFKATKTLKG